MNKNFPAICAIVLMCTLLVVFFGSFASRESDGISLANEQKTVYLTFDDGPSDRVTPKILDVLKQENVKATFFIVGKNADGRKYLLERAKNEGHALGVHSWSHKYKEIYSSPENLLNDIKRCNELIKDVTGEYSEIYRFPGGSYGLRAELINCVTASGFRYYDWNASFRDAEIANPTPEQLFKCATEHRADANKVVLLAHDSTDKRATAQALKDIINYYKNQGYNFDTLAK